MAFKTWRSFMDFEQYVRRNRRFILDNETTNFLQEVRITATKRRSSIPAGTYLWRAQHGHSWRIEQHSDIELDVPAPHKPERMKPLKDRAREGRINPKGIPCLYLATDKPTAIGETRPWVGEHISISQFRIEEELQMIDVTKGNESILNLKWHFEEPNENEREKSVWSAINWAFSKPTTTNDETADYTATQILAELFKDIGFDGIIYESGLGEGSNIAIFDARKASPVNGFLFEITNVKFEFRETANPWFKSSQRSSD